MSFEQLYHLRIKKEIKSIPGIHNINPLLPSTHKIARKGQNFDPKISRDHQKISYESRDYESLDEKSL